MSEGLRAAWRHWCWPERRWHWVLHLWVAAGAAAYWLVSAWVSRGGKRSLAETVLYRPEGDSQYWPVIAALSRFNFGDPTDAFRQGEGVLSLPIAPFVPHALACALFGLHGYAVADGGVALLYFAAVFVWLRVCGVGRFLGLLLGAALATGALQQAFAHLAGAFAVVMEPLGLAAAENHFPNLLELKIHGNRIQRPMVTEIWMVLLMAGLMRLWREPSRATAGFGAGLGGVMGLLAQGDFYSLAVLGLVFAVVVGRIAAGGRGWNRTLGLVGGVLLGAAAVGWVFVWQRLAEHPDVPRRLGLVSYDRLDLLFLPGYAPLVRVGVVVAVGAALWHLHQRRTRVAGASHAALEPALASFCIILLGAAYLAQPAQIFLLGKGAQIYHYLHAVPVFYSYALLALALAHARRAAPAALARLWRRLALAPGGAGAGLLVLVLGCGALLALEKPIKRIYHKGTVCVASTHYQPWGKFGEDYRPALSLMDRGLARDARFAQIRTFSTFNQDVYVLLSAFHGKRAFTPDACTSVLADAAIEERLYVMGRIFNLTPEAFVEFVQRENIKNNFLGSNKYRFASDYRFSADRADYNPVTFEFYEKDKHHRQWGWFLAIPRSELRRMGLRYLEIKALPLNPAACPDLLILDHHELASGLVPSEIHYQPAGSNTVFCLFIKKSPPAAP